MIIVLPTLHVRPSPQAVPLAAGCLAAALPAEIRKDVRLLDIFPDKEEEQVLEEILACSPDLVSFPLYVWNRTAALSLCRRLKKARPGIILVAGGPEASADPEGVMTDGELDFAIRGEGEVSFRELVLALKKKEAPDRLPGLCLRGEDGIVTGPDRAPEKDHDALPSPWLTGVLVPQASGGVLWETSRGCPFACDFCYDARGSRGVRSISEKRMAAELDLFARAGVSQIWVLDSTFNFPPERGKKLLQFIARKAPDIHFHLEAKADFLDKKTAALLSRLSCSVQIGLQSANTEVLRKINRPFDPELFRSKVHLLNVEGATFGLDLIYGLPGDDLQGFRRSLDEALLLAPNSVDVFPLALLPGTSLHGRRESFGIRAQETPPYEILESQSYSRADMAKSRILAAAADLFYNTGRAVAFFPALLAATGMKPADFLEGFASWALDEKKVPEEDFLQTDAWQSDRVLPLQEEYARRQLEAAGRQDLVPAALDLIRYHYHYAETLLGEETLPPRTEFPNAWEGRWRTAPSLRLVPFTYEILDLMEMGEVNLEDFARLFRPVGSTALFLRRGGEVLCESLEEDFIKLLEGSDGKRSPKQIFGGSIPRREGQEVAEFALAEGLLVPGKDR